MSFARPSRQSRASAARTAHACWWSRTRWQRRRDAGSYDFGFERLRETLGKDPRFGFVDLLERYREVPITADNLSEFYWRKDRHHNARGYEVMGDLIADEIVRLGLGPAAAEPRPH